MKKKDQSTSPAPAKKSALMHVLSLLVVFALLASLAMVDTGQLFGYKLTDNAEPEIFTQNIDGEEINTTRPGKGIVGYGGPVPIVLYLSDGTIDSICALPNHETPEFFNKIYDEGLNHRWDGLSIEEAAHLQVDAVSGATYSSKAYIANVQLAVNYALNNRQVLATDTNRTLNVKLIVAILVILAGAILPLFWHNKTYRIVQQLLNAGVLGFWAGTFIDYAMMINFFSSGFIYTLAAVVLLLLLIVGFIYPIMGRGQHYCAWICPYGSLQDLAGHLSKRKLHLRPATVKALENFRRILWVVLITLLFAGWGASWIDYEIFTAFMLKTATWIIISVGALFLLLSIFIPRPFCRFVCATGTLLKII